MQFLFPDNGTADKEMKKDPRISEFFPFPEIRPAQEEALSAIERAHASGKKFVILEVPTGGGKSGIAVAAAQWAKAVLGGGTYILSPQKTLTAQYLGSFSQVGIRELRGRNSYKCSDFGTDCERGPVLRGRDENVCTDCPYRLAKQEFISSSLGVTNFSYYLSEMGHAGKLGRRSMLILDEGHNIETTLLGETDIEINSRQRLRYGIRSLPEANSVEEYRTWVMKVATPAIESYVQEEEKLAYATHEEKIASSQRVSSARRMLLRLGRFVNSNALNEWVAWTTQEKTFVVRPLTPKLHAGRMLFNNADMIIIMSATILDLKTFTRNLNINENDCEFLALPSDFAKENREIHYHPIGSMAKAHQDATLPLLAKFVATVLAEMHPQEKGVIHTHTRKINQYLVTHLRQFDSRIVTYHDSRDRDRALEAHCASSRPTVLLTPGMAEGLDLKDDLSRFQIICKVPYPVLDHYTEARIELDPGWYQWRTALTIVQATGRSVRSKEDYAVTYVTDKGFERFVAKNKHLLPRWWLDAIRWPKQERQRELLKENSFFKS
jgi:ATP-dependent DNA helicase DinG